MSEPAARDGWVEVTVVVPAGLEELAAEAICRAPFTGVLVETERIRTYVSDANDGPELRRRLAEELEAIGAVAVEFRRLEDVDYVGVARESWRPFRVGRVCIQTPDAPPPPLGRDVSLLLEPAGAYGTGRHASTRGALVLLQRFLSPGEFVVDAGTGSGILAIAAVRLGARRAVGFDVDPNSVACGDRLAADNGVSDRVEFHTAGFELLDGVDGRFDGVLANLYYDLLQRHAADLARVVRPGGWIVASGCRADERVVTLAAFERAGIDVETTWRRGRWCAIGGRRRGVVPSVGLEPTTR